MRFRETVKQLFKIDFQKHIVILASFFPAPDPQKRENTSRVKDLGVGVGGWGATPVAPFWPHNVPF